MNLSISQRLFLKNLALTGGAALLGVLGTNTTGGIDKTLVICLVLFVIVVGLFSFQEHVAVKAQTKAAELENLLSVEAQQNEVAYSFAIARRGLREASELLRDQSQITRRLTEFNGDLDKTIRSWTKEAARSGGRPDRRLLEPILKGACEIFQSVLLRQNNYGYVKTTLFEKKSKVGSSEFTLVKTPYWWYPAGRSPQIPMISSTINPRATGVLCIKQRNLVIIEDIEAEKKKPLSKARWHSFRPNQDESGSMICTPVFVNLRERKEGAMVLTLDSNLPGLFKESRECIALISEALAPFQARIREIFEIEEALASALARSRS